MESKRKHCIHALLTEEAILEPKEHVDTHLRSFTTLILFPVVLTSGASSAMSYEYLSLFFSPSCALGIGMDRIAKKIVEGLDYFDVVNLKRSCRLMRAYVEDRMADKRSRWRKLKRDWRDAEASVVELSSAKEVRHAKFYDDCRKILINCGDNVLSFDARSSADAAEIFYKGLADHTISTFDIDEEKQRSEINIVRS